MTTAEQSKPRTSGKITQIGYTLTLTTAPESKEHADVELRAMRQAMLEWGRKREVKDRVMIAVQANTEITAHVRRELGTILKEADVEKALGPAVVEMVTRSEGHEQVTRLRTPTGAAAAAVAKTPQEHTNVKETIESILIAFVLAFMFRAFVVEAFVIPTGSMAPTLLGAHMRFQCDNCGYPFDVNYGASSESGDVSVPSKAHTQVTRMSRGVKVTRVEEQVFAVFCPNCGEKVPIERASGQTVHYGDRILVLKYLYLFEEPQRWDVVVFKSPEDRERFDYTQNYIKRLVGRPGEQVLLLDGDVWVRRHDDEPFVVQTKPKVVQDALWRIVYDNDYRPIHVPGSPPPPQPWTPRPSSTGWTLSGDGTRNGRVFLFDSADGAGTLFFDHTVFRNAHHLSDWLAYDVTKAQSGILPDEALRSIQSTREWFNRLRSPEGDHAVSDLKLAMIYQRRSGDGPLRLHLTKRSVTFIAEIKPGSARLIRRDDGSGDEIELFGPAPLPHGDRAMRIEFENVDYRVTLRIDGKILFQTTPQQYAPDFDALLMEFQRNVRPPLPTVQIEASAQTAAIEHLSLWRDIYYINRGSRHNREPFWASPADFPENVKRLKKDEYFVLGDNSLISGDGRYWSDNIHLPHEGLVNVQAGVVPERFMLGKAFFVYWPAGYRVAGTDISLIPNFGKMRFIH